MITEFFLFILHIHNAYIGNGAVGVDEWSEILFLLQIVGWFLSE